MLEDSSFLLGTYKLVAKRVFSFLQGLGESEKLHSWKGDYNNLKGQHGAPGIIEQ